MNASPWALMRSATQSESLKGSRISRETVGRVVRFARPHSRMLLGFLLTSVVVAVLGVITPVLAGRVVNAITVSGSVDLVVRLALLIAQIAVLDAGFGILNRWLASTIG